MIRISVPAHLRTLAKIPEHEVLVDVDGTATQRTVLDALEARYPALRGCVRDHDTKKRRAFIRFYACEEDLSNEGIDDPLPVEVISGEEPYMIVGAMAGG
ncbi:MoaD/ThiS family protein [Saccharopolyspora griseoalba]|uniref:MoaD/ThiS family protein n=1 Tax=Saccharopolyspora griseoalba TaxID=1431848 RepID=A0ABW2LK09_9PSEU